MKKEKTDGFNPLDATEDEQTDYESCEHIFMPVDATGKTLACTKCGLLKISK